MDLKTTVTFFFIKTSDMLKVSQMIHGFFFFTISILFASLLSLVLRTSLDDMDLLYSTCVKLSEGFTSETPRVSPVIAFRPP